MKKKILLTVLSLTSLAGAMALASCTSDESESSTSSVSDHIEFETDSINLVVGESLALKVSVSGNAEGGVTFRSMDTDVAIVGEDGIVIAVGTGSAEIRAIYGKSLAKCTVNVSLGDYVPVIEFDYVSASSIAVIKNSPVDLSSSVKFNGARYDFEAWYALSDDSFGSISPEGLFMPVKTGTVVVTASGEFCGVKAVSRSITIDVQEDVVIYMKNEGLEASAIHLSTVGEYGTSHFKTVAEPTFGVIVSDVEVVSPNLTITLIDEKNVVTHDPATHRIVSTGAVGEASFNVEYTTSGGVTVMKTFMIYSNRPSVDYIQGKPVEVDPISAKFPVEDIFKDFADKEIVKATSFDGSVEYEIIDGRVKGIVALPKGEEGLPIQKVKVSNSSITFNVDVVVYDRVVTEASDLEYFHYAGDSSVFDGNYIMTEDIDASSYTLPNHFRTAGVGYKAWATSGLVGTFDGRGHTIRGITLGEGGLFGNIGSGGVVKNLGIVDAKFSAPEPNVADDKTVLSSFLNGSTLENVYIQMDSMKKNYNAGLVAMNIMHNCVVKNCLFECPQSDWAGYTNFGSLTTMYAERTALPSGSGGVYKDVYVVSPMPLCRNSGKYIVDVTNDFYKETGFENFVLEGVGHYKSATEMASARKGYESFDRTYWSVDSYKLTWKNK